MIRPRYKRSRIPTSLVWALAWGDLKGWLSGDTLWRKNERRPRMKKRLSDLAKKNHNPKYHDTKKPDPANQCVACGAEMPEGDHVCSGCRTRKAIYPHGLNIRVNDAQMAAIEQACIQKDMRISEVVRGALDVWMDGLVDELQSDVPDYLNPHRMVGR